MKIMDIQDIKIKPQSSCPFQNARQKILVWDIILSCLYMKKQIQQLHVL